MSAPPEMTPLTPAYDAILCDLDGVITDTAAIHAQAWKHVFDEVLPQLTVGDCAPFDPVRDYRSYVDGRPRIEGIRSFLNVRNIPISAAGVVGDPSAIAGPRWTVQALAALKQQYFDFALRLTPPEVIAGSREFITHLRQRGVRTAVVTSSRNGERVLRAAGISHLFDVLVDGATAAQLELPGKPDPATYLEAARRLAATPERSVVIEDAEAGVQAAVRGGFGLVIGLDRDGYGDRLRAAGAEMVVSDLSEIDLDDLLRGELDVDTPLHPGAGEKWPAVRRDDPNDPWVLRYVGFDPSTEGQREVLCALGNGYWGTRGAAPEAPASAVHYPGTYLAGVYNRLHTDRDGHPSDDEHMVNAPNWLPLWFHLDGRDSAAHCADQWFQPGTADLLDYAQELDLRRGILTREFRFQDRSGRITRVTSNRFVSQAAPHVAVLDTQFEAENWSGILTVRSALDSRVTNNNVAANRLLNNRHLIPRTHRQIDPQTVLLEAETTQSGVHIALAARTRVFASTSTSPTQGQRHLIADATGLVGFDIELALAPGAPTRVEKVVTVATSRDRASLSPAHSVTTQIQRLPETATLLAEHERAWQILWDEFAVHLTTGQAASLALNLNTFHVLQTMAAVDADLDAGVPARGLHGEGYQGHVFWDEIFVYPILTLRRPDLSRALLGYRYRRLAEARAAAASAGFDGAMFPWQSGIDGRDVTPTELLNPLTNAWMPDRSCQQRHVGLAIAYSVWQYYQATEDTDFLIAQGAELVLEIARFFASLAVFNTHTQRYSISGVMGPDEFHDGYPGARGQGLTDNAYTNVMTSWVLQRAVDIVTLLEGRYCRPLWNRLRLRPAEVAHWQTIATRLRVPFHADGVISQFDGYEALAEFDWDRYRARYGSIRRLDLILESEGDSCNNYRVSKQPDVLMLLYLFSAEELRELLKVMGYPLPPEAVVRTVEFYGARSTHGSTLSNVVHSWLEARRDRARSWEFFSQALNSDLADIQGGTTREGIHLGAMAGSIDMVVRCYTGLEVRDDKLWFHPVLPSEVRDVTFSINYRENPIRLDVTARTLRLTAHVGGASPITVVVDGRETTIIPGETREFVLP